VQELLFDRVLGNPSVPATILYGDITSPEFGHFHTSLVKMAREGKLSYRVRHRRPLSSESKPLTIPGYGVELALKRTDYIVIDDRDDNKVQSETPGSETKVKFEDEEFADLKPLSSSELLSLSVKTSSFIMQSETPFDTLLKLSQDFPKYSSAIATHNSSENFVSEHEYNRRQLVPAGYNAWWINGVQLIERQANGLSLLEILRKERKLIKGVTDLDFTAQEAIELLTHSEISAVKAEDEPPRYDWRDSEEGGTAIIWMNDLEKDKRYAEWPEALSSMLQQTFPGQLPSVRRDCFTLVLPVDLTNLDDVYIVADTLLSFVKRKLAIHIGIVPITASIDAVEQAAVVYHLLDTYGLSAVTEYLGALHKSKSAARASKAIFDSTIKGKKLRPEKSAQRFEDILKSDEYNNQVQASKNWVRRLGADSKIPPLFVDGIAIPRDETFLQAMSSKITSDLRAIQMEIFKESFEPDTWLPGFFLSNALKKRNPLIAPEDDKDLRIFDINKLFGGQQEVLEMLPRIKADPSSAKSDWGYMTLIADLNSEAGGKLLSTAVLFREANPSIELMVVHNPTPGATNNAASNQLYARMRNQSYKALQNANELLASSKEGFEQTSEFQQEADRYWQAASHLVRSISFQPGQSGLLLNGRLLGPLPDSFDLDLADFEQLLSYERSNRISPAYAAVDGLGLSDKLKDPLSAAKISSILALSTVSDTPDGIFESAPTIRLGFKDIWNSSYTAIEVGDISTASIQMTVLVDPASEQGQRWLPMIKVLSEIEGVYLKLFLNPKGSLQELPVKRFYRYVLNSKPTFDESGSLESIGASFTGVPQEALLTVGLDTPPAWLVAPKTSIHDLDNIKLSSIKSDVEAIYELKNILIEGHSRQIPGGAAPSGAQLVLRTEREPHFADTIIMANLGYFQFKANPGFYKIDLQEGRSSEIFKFESIGSQGWAPVPGDERTEVVLMSFQGATLYPRLTRKPGMEKEDVLDAKLDSPASFVSRGLNFAQGILGGGKDQETRTEPQAEINIFSVASGHLYERMLNIMMVSVMKHTKHTVKFWFIEQFLSPSFKDFIPFLAAEYGFQYEMVTFKWPHWLRKQTEKQREIWGYKILFLDVLFPLSLDKVIFVDADQIVRTDMIDLVNHDLKGAPYGFTPMCDSRTEMEGFRFWKQGYWERFLRGLPYHISALYVVDLKRFRQMAAGDRLRQQYHSLSADPNSLSNLDQDLPNHMQTMLPIHSLPQEWLWCETWCSDESLKEARTIDLCNNPLTKEPKLDRARRQVPEWTVYDDEIAGVDKKRKGIDDSEEKMDTGNAETKEDTRVKDEL
jgi:UDP-glucose:glycoprotein glucosyltransferase